MLRASILACIVLLAMPVPSPVFAATAPTSVRIAFIPLDDRPATEYFPQEVAAICGATLELPPHQALGHFAQPGDPAAVARWLLNLDVQGLSAVVISTDMLAYGGLVASRIPATPLGDAAYRLGALAQFHRSHPEVPVYAFGTVMRLAPTATPASAAYLDALTHYAQLAGVTFPTPAQRKALAISRSHVPAGVFWDYIGSRARDLDVDESLLAMTENGSLAALSLTQDDAGAQLGLQVSEQARLHALVDRMRLGKRVLLNPGTDEMGMVMVVRAIEDAVSWSPSVGIAYPSAIASSSADPLEYVSIAQTTANLAGFLRMNVSADGDFELAVLAPEPNPANQTAFWSRLTNDLRGGKGIAIADLSFLATDGNTRRFAVESLGRSGLAAKPLAYASWNTTANSVGTALAESAATLLGRHFGTLDESAAATFLFDRYVDDYGYQSLVRPALQEQLHAFGMETYALGDDAARAESIARSLLWREALSIFDEDFKTDGWHASAISIFLPWQRTFEVRLDASLTR